MLEVLLGEVPKNIISFQEIPFYKDWDFWSAIAATLSAGFAILVLLRTERREYQMNKSQLAFKELIPIDRWNQGSRIGHSVLYTFENTGRYEANVRFRLLVWDADTSAQYLDDVQELPYPLASNELARPEFIWDSVSESNYRLLLIVSFVDKIGGVESQKKIWQVYQSAVMEEQPRIIVATVNEINQYPKYEY